MPDVDIIFLRALNAQRKRLKSLKKQQNHKNPPILTHYSPSQRKGFAEEQRALTYLESQGLYCLARNYQNMHDEIDLIMTDGQILIFVEVRSRQKKHFGGALESINIHKKNKIIRAANRYLQQTKAQKPCRFDVVAIDQGKISWITNAFSSLT